MDDPRKNKEGYSDPTAYYALRAAARDEAEAEKRAIQVIAVVKFILQTFGFELIQRIQIKDKKTGREFK